MAKFIVTSGSHFTPYSYDELMKPVALAQAAYDATDDNYNKIAEDTASLQRYISDSPEDKEAKLLYNSYIDKLNSFRNDLWNNGITSGTRKQFSDARAAYVSDIGRLKQAVQSRMERGKAYWDMKHNHPDLIMGTDPSTSGLDAYLNDANYGQDYYTYSGSDFMKQVGIDAATRAKEIRRELQFKGKPIPGYITRIEQIGYTSDEVNNATNAVTNAFNTGNRDFSGLTAEEKVLADVLLANVDSTGAFNKVSPEEFSRLIKYGRDGLSHAITGQERKDYALNLSQYSGSRQSSRNSDFSNRYDVNRTISEMQSMGFKKYAKNMEKYTKSYENPIFIKLPDGSYKGINSEWEMSEYVFNTPGREMIRRKLGLDVALRGSYKLAPIFGKQEGITTDKEGVQHKVYTKYITDQETRAKIGGDIGVYNAETDIIQYSASREFNKARKEYFDHLDSMQNLNPDINFNKVAITPDVEKKLREQNDINKTIKFSDLKAALDVINVRGDFAPVPIVGTDSSHDYARNNLGNAIWSTANKNSVNGVIDKGSDTKAIYEIKQGKGGFDREEKGITNIKEIFGDGKFDPMSISYIDISPFDFSKYNRPTVRFAVKNKLGHEYMADITLLGTQAYDRFLQPTVPTDPTNPNAPVISAFEAIKYMMQPITNPNLIFNMSDQRSQEYANNIYNILVQSQAAQKYMPFDFDGETFSKISAKEMANNSEHRNKLYHAITQFTNEFARKILDVNQQDHAQYVGNQSANARGYND